MSFFIAFVFHLLRLRTFRKALEGSFKCGSTCTCWTAETISCILKATSSWEGTEHMLRFQPCTPRPPRPFWLKMDLRKKKEKKKSPLVFTARQNKLPEIVPLAAFLQLCAVWPVIWMRSRAVSFYKWEYLSQHHQNIFFLSYSMSGTAGTEPKQDQWDCQRRIYCPTAKIKLLLQPLLYDTREPWRQILPFSSLKQELNYFSFGTKERILKSEWLM